MKRLLLACVVSLVGCSSPLIHTEVTTPICVAPHHGYHYTTCVPLSFTVEHEKFVIPPGFDTDLASIPRIAWPLAAPFRSEFMRPAIVHDWLYRYTCVFSRADADLIFYEMLKNEGVSSFKASIMYWAVRWFGASHYSEGYCDSNAD